MKFLDQIPNWLRWFLILPGTFLILFVTVFIVKISLSLLWGSNNFDAFIGEAVASGLGSYAFVWVGAKIAPKYNFFVSVALGLVLIFMLGSAFYLKIFFEDHSSTSWPLLIVCGGVNIFAIIWATITVRESAEIQ